MPFFPGPILQAIVNLNYLHHCGVFADTIFAHLELIRSVFWYVMHSWKTQTWTLTTHSRSYAESAKFVKGLCSWTRFSGYIAACRCTGWRLQNLHSDHFDRRGGLESVVQLTWRLSKHTSSANIKAQYEWQARPVDTGTGWIWFKII